MCDHAHSQPYFAVSTFVLVNKSESWFHQTPGNAGFAVIRAASEVRMGQSIWQNMQQKGYSRRDFMQFCGAAAAIAGLGRSGVAQVVSAFEKKEKPAVVWMHFQECT